MAQPTNCDGSRDSSRLGHNYLRRKQWRRKLPRAPRRRPRRSGSSSGSLGCSHTSTPFFSRQDSPIACIGHHDASHRDHRPACQAAECAEITGGTRSSISERGDFTWRRRQPRRQSRRRRRSGNSAFPVARGARPVRTPCASIVRPASSASASAPHYRSLRPSHTVTFRTMSPRRIPSTTSMPSTTRPNAV